MKTTTLTVALLLVVATAFATEKEKTPNTTDAKVALVKNAPNKYKLVYLDKEPSKIKLEVTDENGATIHTETIKNKNGFSRPYNFEELPEGEYTVSVTSDKEEVLNKKLTVENIKKSTDFVSNLLDVNDNKKFRLAVINENKTVTPISVKIYNEKDQLLYSETIENLSGFSKNYDLKKSDGDSFRFYISNGSTSKSIMTP